MWPVGATALQAHFTLRQVDPFHEPQFKGMEPEWQTIDPEKTHRLFNFHGIIWKLSLIKVNTKVKDKNKEGGNENEEVKKVVIRKLRIQALEGLELVLTLVKSNSEYE